MEKCLNCGREFKSRNKNHKYCSRKCAQENIALNKSIYKNCLNCGKEMKVSLCHKETKKYCSRKCKDQSQKDWIGEKNYNFNNHVLKGRLKSTEELEKQSKGAIETWKTKERQEKHKLAQERYKEKTGYYPMQDPVSREKARESILKKMSNGEYEAKVHRGLMGHYISKKTNIKEYYHSSYELIRMMELDEDNKVVFWTKKHKICIQLEGKHWYIPDFLIEYNSGKKTIEEVKGYIRNKELFESQIKAATEYCKKEDYEYKINYMNHLRKSYGKN